MCATENCIQAFTKPALVQCRDPNLETVDARIVDRPLRPCGTSLRRTGAGAVQIDPSIIRQIQRVPTAPPSVVALGDSAISGEAGRWAGNTNQASSKTDALGSTAYNDIPGAESTPGCHRSKSAEVHIGDGVQSVEHLLLRRAHVLAHERRQVQARHRLLLQRRLARARRSSSRSTRDAQQREGRRRPDRRQRLRLRGDPRDLRDQLADVAVVVEELLPGRREPGPDVLGVEHQQDHQRRQERVPERQDGDDAGRL